MSDNLSDVPSISGLLSQLIVPSTQVLSPVIVSVPQTASVQALTSDVNVTVPKSTSQVSPSEVVLSIGQKCSSQVPPSAVHDTSGA